MGCESMGLLGITDTKEIHTSCILSSTDLHWILRKRLDLYPRDFLSDPDPPPLHDSHILLISLLSPGQESIMPLSQWQNTSKNLGPDHYLTLPQGNRILSLSKTEAGPGQHRIPTSTHHQASKHEQEVIEEYCWGRARVHQENPSEVQVPREVSKLQIEQEFIF